MLPMRAGGRVSSALIKPRNVMLAPIDHLENSGALLWIKTDISERLHTSAPLGIELFC